MPEMASRGKAVRLYHRGSHRENRARELSYTVYLGVLVLLGSVAPVARAVVLSLADAPIIRSISDPRTPQWIAFAGCILVALLIAVGGVRGPALLRPVFVWTIASNDLPRRTALYRPFLLAAGLYSLAVGTLAAMVGAALVLASRWTVATAVVLAAASVLFSIIGATAWLLGQVLKASSAALVGVAILVSGLATMWTPASRLLTPWGWFSELFGSSAAATPLLMALATASALCLIGAYTLIDRLGSTALMAQALRWERATVASISGDLSLSLALYRPAPALGRAWRAVRGGRDCLTYWRRGLIGSMRTPLRLLVAILGLALGNALVAAVVVTSPAAAGAAGGMGAVLIFLALGAVSDGLRHAAEASAAPALYGYRTRTLVLLLLIFPASLAIGFAVIFAAPLACAGHPSAFAVCGCAAIVALLLRIMHSAKGPLPPLLLTPIPTPAGDLSGLVVLAWQADAVLMAFLAGAVSAASLASSGVGAVALWASLFAAAIGWLISRRYRRR